MAGNAPLAPEEGRFLLALARESLTRYIRSGEFYSPPDVPPQLTRKGGAFVTLTVKGTGALRGCIGRIVSPNPLWQTVRDMAIASGVSDNRFRPVSAGELSDCRIKVSVLSPLSKINDPGQIIVGTHGVMVKASGQTGVFLPEVATEMGWDVPALLDHLCFEKCCIQKDAWRKPGTEIYVFESQIFSEEG